MERQHSRTTLYAILSVAFALALIFAVVADGWLEAGEHDPAGVPAFAPFFTPACGRAAAFQDFHHLMKLFFADIFRPPNPRRS